MRKDATVLSLSDMDGKTGNRDYQDCHIPTDDEILDAAQHYKLSGDIKVTITSAVGVKTKFTVNVKDSSIERTSETKCDLSILERMALALRNEELQKIMKFKNSKVAGPIMEEFGIRKEDICAIVAEKRKGIWSGISDEYSEQMFNCALAEYIAEGRV